MTEAIMIFAVLVAPLLAVQATKYLERQREKRDAKFRIFRILMATRATGLSWQHVEALNLIDIEFHGRKYKRITDAWKIYLDHLAQPPPDESGRIAHNDKREDLLISLLQEMGKVLGYEFDSVHLKRAAYVPKGHIDFEQEGHLLRKVAIQVLSGQQAISMNVQSLPELMQPPEVEAMVNFMRGLVEKEMNQKALKPAEEEKTASKGDS